MSLSEPCRECGRTATIPGVVPYFVIRPNGTATHAWLHPQCAEAWMVKYRRWRRERV